MDITSLYTNIPQKEGINVVCPAYETFYNDTPSFPKLLLGKVLTTWPTCKHGTTMGTKIVVAFPIIFMGELEKQMLNESAHKLLARKR